MPTIYRNVQTKQLVHLSRVSPRHILGSWFEETELFSGKSQKVAQAAVTRTGHQTLIDPRHYVPVAHH